MYLSTVFMLFFTILDVLVYYLLKQHEEHNHEQKDSSLLSSFDQQSVQIEDNGEKGPSTSSPDNQCRHFSLAEIKSATNDFDDAFVIGKGGFGKVYKGKIDVGPSTDVAIKRLNLDSNQGASEFWAEIEMLSKFRHSHIVSLFGYCEKQMILVYEYMPNGSLEDHLHKKRANGSNSSPLTWIQRLNICIGAARGLDYLHTGTGVQCRVIHRDVKSSNVLLDHNLTAKISDFGLSRIGPMCQPGSTTNVYTDQIKGTFGYMDAEYFSTRRLTRKSDVYAYGVVLLEVLCGRPALDFTLDEQQHSLAGWARQCIKEGKIDQIIDPSLRGQVESNCLKEFGQIAYECVLNSSKDRPTMTKVLARLEFVLNWSLQCVQRATNRKHIGKSMFIKKAWSVFLTKGAKNGSGRQVVPPKERQRMIPQLKIFTFSELKTATKNFSQKMFLGEGGYGKVYVGWLDSLTLAPQKDGDGLAVAIKKSSPNRTQGLNEWQAEVEFLGTYSHPNVIKLLGYCWENKNFLLVYEYMQKGSLDMQLFRDFEEGAEPLSWDRRVKIAMGAAQGLAFLHATENNVICRDVGPVNGESHVSTGIAGTYGYMAPEYVATEILTGLRASDYTHNGVKQNLVEYAKPFLINIKKLQRIIDPRLDQNFPTKGVIRAAELILSCLEPVPKNRPSMKEVVLVLQGISASKMKPSQSKSEDNSMSVFDKERSDYCYQNHYWSPLRSKQGKRAWSTSSRLLGLEMCIGLKRVDETWTETNSRKGDIEVRNREKGGGSGWSMYAYMV
ncbi:hypothetical protein E3N88_38004 [Mikania micrantha]|uniref:non-specific serine/threonine protein kinase n=1 Tax=Mikania micrantha TaxID=192012 RepID=A0A5N6LSQ8_9ASTR|nr:hypothetical protein E3N88_38004 [Mikania micrantha]